MKFVFLKSDTFFSQISAKASPFITYTRHRNVVNATLKITWSQKVEYLSNNTESIPPSGGVYEIQGRKMTDGGYTRRYVGVTDNLKETYAGYLSGKGSNEKLNQFLQKKKSFFRYVKINNEQIRKDLERGLYHKYRHSFIDSENQPSGSGKYAQISVEEKND